MNLTLLITELKKENIDAKSFSINYDTKEILLSLFVADIKVIIQAHSILENHSSQYKANGFKLQVLYGINI